MIENSIAEAGSSSHIRAASTIGAGTARPQSKPASRSRRPVLRSSPAQLCGEGGNEADSLAWIERQIRLLTSPTTLFKQAPSRCPQRPGRAKSRNWRTHPRWSVVPWSGGQLSVVSVDFSLLGRNVGLLGLLEGGGKISLSDLLSPISYLPIWLPRPSNFIQVNPTKSDQIQVNQTKTFFLRAELVSCSPTRNRSLTS
jgi:hypothetical protein